MKLLKWLLVLGGVMALGVGSYQTASDLAEREVARLKKDVGELLKRATDLDEQNSRLQSEAGEARQREAEWRRRYEQDVPRGRSKQLLSLLETYLAKGGDSDRLEFTIDAAANAPSCDGKPITKRFLVRTPLYRGASDAVSFANNAITVTAEGRPATDDGGNPEAWFDPAKPVTVYFTELGGRGTQASGLVPLYYSAVLKGSEYRFSILSGDRRGFLNVTADRCRFP